MALFLPHNFISIQGGEEEEVQRDQLGELKWPQMDRTTQRFALSTKITANSPAEPHLRGEGGSGWSPKSSLRSQNEPEQRDLDPAHHQKKSVLTKVKENAIRLKHTLSNKKKPGEVDDGNSTPPSSVVEDENEEDGEFLGAPMYESEKSPEAYKENLRQHPRADPVISEKHLLPSFAKQCSGHEGEKLHNPNPGKTEAETGYEMPASLKKLSLLETKSHPTLAEPTAVNSSKKMTRSMTEKLPPTHQNSSNPDHPMLTPQGRLSRETPFSSASTTRSGFGEIEQGQVPFVKESSIPKCAPGEEMASEKTPAAMGVLEKMKETVSSLLWTDEPSRSTAMHSAQHPSSHSPPATNAHAGEEAETVRTLQPN